MRKLIPVCAAMGIAAAASVSGEDFPLTFHTIPAKDIMSSPGGFGASVTLRPDRPDKLRREPRAVSRHPLYSVVRETVSGGEVLVRLDESRGDGKGYDQLIVDMNQNGDLTDDPVVHAVQPEAGQRVMPQLMFFGPIQAPADKALVGGRPVYYARVYVYNRQLLSVGLAGQDTIFGRVMLKAGWYLDTTVTLNGLKQKVGVYDGDANQHLGDLPRLQCITNRSDITAYFRGGDSFLVDANESGSFARGVGQGESCGFGPILYLGAKPYKVALAPDCRSLRVDPWPEALAEVALRPRGDQVRSVTLAWEQPEGRWQLMQPAVTGGKVKVPAGNYQLYTCSLAGKGSTRDQIMLSATQRSVQAPVSVAAGQANTFNCGAPLTVKVSAVKSRTVSSALLDRFSADAGATPGSSLRISAVVTGGAGETYSTFQLGDRPNSKPPRPTFTIVDAGGRQVGSGNLEYG